MKNKILIFDDNISFLKMFVEAFSKDYDIKTYNESLNFLKIIEEEMPNLLILDINMPDIGGIEIIRELKKIEKLKNIPIIVITASDYNGITESLLRNETALFGFLSKLTSFEVIKEKIEKALGDNYGRKI